MKRANHFCYRQSDRGVTLVEIFIVIGMIAILATVAVAGVMRWIRSSRFAEGSEMVASIKVAQENYYSLTGKYCDVSKTLEPPDLYPATKPGNFAKPWGGACTQCKKADGWSKLGINPDREVRFAYATVAGDEKCDTVCRQVNITQAGVKVNFEAMAGGAVSGPWYIVQGLADNNDNGIFAKVVGHSFNTVFIAENEDE